MPAATRLGDTCTGHACWPPRKNIEASEDFFINGIGAHREGDAWEVHCCDDNCHDSVLAEGHPTVFINNKPAAVVGSAIACGSASAQGSPNLFFGA